MKGRKEYFPYVFKIKACHVNDMFSFFPVREFMIYVTVSYVLESRKYKSGDTCIVLNSLLPELI